MLKYTNTHKNTDIALYMFRFYLNPDKKLYKVYVLTYCPPQGKINDVRRNYLNGANGPGFEVLTSPVIIINALGFVGFKMLGVAGDIKLRYLQSLQTLKFYQEYLWTMKCNIDEDLFPAGKE